METSSATATSLAGALLSLEGLSVGDGFGERFLSGGLAPTGALPAGPWRWTDDTHMALSIVETLRDRSRIEQDALAAAFARRFAADPHRGYGGGAFVLLAALARGADWRVAAPQLFGGGSYGNGAAMRAAPIGGFFRGDPARAAAEAQLAAAVTHAHPEGQAGAMAVAVAAALAAGASPPTGRGFLEAALPFVPAGETRTGLEAALEIPEDRPERAARVLGTGFRVSAQDTVPFCLWCAAWCAGDFEKAMWRTAAGRGDCDTTCAIVGGIVALAARGVPPAWIERREPLPAGFQRPALDPSHGGGDL